MNDCSVTLLSNVIMLFLLLLLMIKYENDLADPIVSDDQAEIGEKQRSDGDVGFQTYIP